MYPQGDGERVPHEGASGSLGTRRQGPWWPAVRRTGEGRGQEEEEGAAGVSGGSSAGPLPGLLSGVSQLHLGAELGPVVGPAEAVVADAEEPLGEAQCGHQQGDTQEEQHPLAHSGLLLLQVQAQEVDAAGAREGAFQASWAGRKESGRWAGPGTPRAPQP